MSDVKNSKVKSSDKELAKEATLLNEQAEEQFLDSSPLIDIGEMLSVVKPSLKEVKDTQSWADQVEASNQEDDDAELEELRKRAESLNKSSTTSKTTPVKPEPSKSKDEGKQAKAKKERKPKGVKAVREKKTLPHIEPESVAESKESSVLEVDDSEIDESIASIQDMSEFRNNLDSFNDKIESLEEKIQLIMLERDVLPDKLNNMRDDMNAQLTLMLDKLNRSLESNVENTSVLAAAADLTSIRVTSAEGLDSAAGYLRSEPDKSSPLVTTQGGLKKGKKFKPVY